MSDSEEKTVAEIDPRNFRQDLLEGSGDIADLLLNDQELLDKANGKVVETAIPLTTNAPEHVIDTADLGPGTNLCYRCPHCNQPKLFLEFVTQTDLLLGQQGRVDDIAFGLDGIVAATAIERAIDRTVDTYISSWRLDEDGINLDAIIFSQPQSNFAFNQKFLSISTDINDKLAFIMGDAIVVLAYDKTNNTWQIYGSENLFSASRLNFAVAHPNGNEFLIFPLGSNECPVSYYRDVIICQDIITSIAAGASDVILFANGTALYLKNGSIFAVDSLDVATGDKSNYVVGFGDELYEPYCRLLATENDQCFAIINTVDGKTGVINFHRAQTNPQGGPWYIRYCINIPTYQISSWVKFGNDHIISIDNVGNLAIWLKDENGIWAPKDLGNVDANLNNFRDAKLAIGRLNNIDYLAAASLDGTAKVFKIHSRQCCDQ